MDQEIELLAQAIDRTCYLLHTFGAEAARPRMIALAERLRAGDQNAIATAVSETTGGMGSLNDQNFQSAAARELFQTAVRQVEKLARLAAAKHEISLVR
jgi:hypothetical protein